MFNEQNCTCKIAVLCNALSEKVRICKFIDLSAFVANEIA